MTVIKRGGRVRDGDLRHAWQVVERACCWWRYKARDWSAESRGLAAPRFAASDVTPCARADDMVAAARALPDYS